MKAWYLLSLGVIAAPAMADVRLPHILSDHMVVQAGQPVQVWGWADPGERVTVRLQKTKAHTKAGTDGHWQLTLPAPAATAEPVTMTVEGHNHLILSDVLVGEVWLASGQSNMEKPIGEQKGQKPTLNAEAEIAAANYPDIRLFKVVRKKAATPQDDVDGVWVRCDPRTIDQTHFSAAAYFFGRKLHTELKTPVGLIDTTWGGTRIELWTPASGFGAVPALANFTAAAPGAQVEGTPLSTLYNGQVAGLVPFAIKGLIWYHGESNIIDNDDGARYADKMTALVGGWRHEWKQNFSVYYVQVAPHLYHVVRPTQVVDPQATPRLWEAQTASMRLPKTGMIVTTDLADDLFDIHPRDKKTVGERLANWALARDYGRTGIVVSGPMFQGMTVSQGKTILSFAGLGGGLKSSNGKPLTWFAIAGADGRYYPAMAVIDGDHVVVSSPKVSQPVTVRFAWDEAAQPNLVNVEGLPAIPFRSDNPLGVLPAEAVQ